MKDHDLEVVTHGCVMREISNEISKDRAQKSTLAGKIVGHCGSPNSYLSREVGLGVILRDNGGQEDPSTIWLT